MQQVKAKQTIGLQTVKTKIKSSSHFCILYDFTPQFCRISFALYRCSFLHFRTLHFIQALSRLLRSRFASLIFLNVFASYLLVKIDCKELSKTQQLTFLECNKCFHQLWSFNGEPCSFFSIYQLRTNINTNIKGSKHCTATPEDRLFSWAIWRDIPVICVIWISEKFVNYTLSADVADVLCMHTIHQVRIAFIVSIWQLVLIMQPAVLDGNKVVLLHYCT